MTGRAAALGLALAVDWFLGEPPARLHPVVWMGCLARSLERGAPRGNVGAVAYGGILTAATLAAAALGGAAAERVLALLPAVPNLVGTALLLKPTFAVRALLAAGDAVRRPLERGDLAGARQALRSLCSRDASALDAEHVASGAIESLAENAVDSAVAPWLAYLVGGLPGAYAYRAANTLDAMIGYHGEYEYLGKCAARLDDLLNLAPARLTAGLVLLGAALADGDARRGLAAARRDHGATESPNAGWPMSAMAGALGVRLEKVGHYRLGDSLRPIGASDIARARRIVGRGLTAAALLLLFGHAGHRRLRSAW